MALFTPYRIGSLELRNRIVIAPMCQYSADGRSGDRLARHPPRPPRDIRGRYPVSSKRPR